MKIFTSGICLGAATLLLSALSIQADSQKIGMLIGYESVENNNPQESTAAKWFTQTYPEGTIITPSQTNMIDTEKLDAIWIHIDRVGLGLGFGNLPEEFKNETVMNALKKYVKEGGNLYLSKFSTQMVHELDRIPAEYAPGIFGDGDGGPGTDVWCVNAFLGSMQLGLPEPDYDQVYDHTVHAIYTNLESFQPNSE